MNKTCLTASVIAMIVGFASGSLWAIALAMVSFGLAIWVDWEARRITKDEQKLRDRA